MITRYILKPGTFDGAYVGAREVARQHCVKIAECVVWKRNMPKSHYANLKILEPIRASEPVVDYP